MSLAVTDLFRTRWSDRIHEEWIEAVLRDKPQLGESLERTRQIMDAVLPDADVTGYEGLIDGLKLPDPNDRHVLAAAILGRADVIVTFNLQDFPANALASFHIEAQHPDEFIAHVLTLDPSAAITAIKEMRARLVKPPFTAEEFLELLARQGLAKTVTILEEHVGLIYMKPSMSSR